MKSKKPYNVISLLFNGLLLLVISFAAHAQTKDIVVNAIFNSDKLTKSLSNIEYRPPLVSDVEKQSGPSGAMVQLGYLIFNNTPAYAGKYINSGLSCKNCHMQNGTQSGAAPMWGAFPNYPVYRSKNNLFNSFANRVQGCFLYSMNGVAPPLGGEVIEAISAYAAWMSQGLPLGVSLKGRGFPEVKNFTQPSISRGGILYQEQCAICHGSTGQGIKSRSKPEFYQFPPLWGPDSYNWGAGMHKESNFRNFIKANMPLGQGGRLTDQEAADIAAFVNQPAHARPVRINDPGQAPSF